MAGFDDRVEYLLGIGCGTLNKAQDVGARGLEGAGFREFAHEGGAGRCFALSHN